MPRLHQIPGSLGSSEDGRLRSEPSERVRPEPPLVPKLIILGHIMSHIVERRLARYDLNHTQGTILLKLSHGGPLTAQELAQTMRLEPPSITRALQTLERRAFIERYPHPTDGRASILAVTAEGQIMSNTLDSLLEGMTADLLEGVSEKDVARLNTCLTVIFKRVEILRESNCSHKRCDLIEKPLFLDNGSEPSKSDLDQILPLAIRGDLA